ncbi:MAG: outer membrane protein assembly factor [Chitinophagaceae bacterium]|nr:outer membrane protein assembly factor [Chitinophagaceae bacterium]
MRLLNRLLFSPLLFHYSILSPQNPQTDSATAAGGNFVDKKSRHIWMGSNYRKEWNTPITVPVLYLSKEKGGLSPVRRGGGKQTKSLRLEDKNGRQYVIRSIAKYITSKTLGQFESEAAADLVADGVSASYPYAALSIPDLAEVAGIPHQNPKVMFVADDPALGEFRNEFANMLVLFEERFPDSVKKGYDTDEVADTLLRKDNDNTVDQRALLRIRILDMFVMDFDRHEDQWNWGAWDNGKGKTFYPIAKDRDQAFYINRGILPGLMKARSLVPQLEGFKSKANHIGRFNFAARNLDRFFLNQLTENEWREETERFLSAMTDAVLEKALSRQPREIRNISGPRIVSTLKERRKYLMEDVMEYYRFISEKVNITGSDKQEHIDIIRNDDGSLRVQMYKINKEGQTGAILYDRLFDPQVTKEVCLYGMGGNDRFIVKGTSDKIKVRLIGGDGEDLFENTVPNNNNTIIYDRRDEPNIVKGPFKNRMSRDTAVNSFQRIFYKYPYQSIFFMLGYGPDDGISIGPTFKYIRHGFRRDPYKSYHYAKALVAFSTGAFRFVYNNEFSSVFGRKTDLTGEIDYRGPNNTINFFGYGMNSVYNKNNPGQFRFYRVRFNMGEASLMVRHRFSEKVQFSLGPAIQIYTYDSADKFNKIRNIELNPPPGITSSMNHNQSYAGIRFLFMLDTRNHNVLPYKGIYWNTQFRYWIGLNNKSYQNVPQFNTDFVFHVGLAKDWLVWVNRTGFGANLTSNMNFEFYQAQTLGSNDNLRGYRRERFSGKSCFYNQSELRWKWANLKTYLFPASIGMFAFWDIGRVWVHNDAVSDLGMGFGGGIWFSPLKRLALNISVAKSEEDFIPMMGMNWRF